MLSQDFTRLTEEEISRIPDLCGHTYNKCSPYFTNTRTALDVGCKQGVFARHMQEDFARVFMFDMRPKMQWRFLDQKKCKLLACALGETVGTIKHSGALTNVSVPGVEMTESELKTIDSFEFQDVDFIKIDVEGDEVAVLKGATETLAKHKPVVVLEQNHTTEQYGKGKYGDAVRWLQENNYKIADYNGVDDWIMIHV